MVLAMTLAGACAGAGLLLVVRGLVGSTTPLDVLVADLHRPRTQHAPDDRRRRIVERLAGAPTPDRATDLAVLERTLDKYLEGRLTWSMLAAAPGLALLLLTATGSMTLLSPGVLVIIVVGGAIGGWFYAPVDLRSDAETARRDFRHALAAYLELVTILMAGGAGVETALFDAASAGRGPAFRHIRSALTAAQARRQPPWKLLGELGDRLGVSELVELHSSMTLAGDGAQVRNSLGAMAAGMRRRDLAQIETEAQSKSEAMVLPVALMFAGFLILIGYPALSALTTP